MLYGMCYYCAGLEIYTRSVDRTRVVNVIYTVYCGRRTEEMIRTPYIGLSHKIARWYQLTLYTPGSTGWSSRHRVRTRIDTWRALIVSLVVLVSYVGVLPSTTYACGGRQDSTGRDRLATEGACTHHCVYHVHHLQLHSS